MGSLLKELKRIQHVALPGENEQEIISSFEEMALAGENLEPYIKYLIEAFRSSSNVTVMRPVANAIAIHCVNEKQVVRLSRLLHRDKFTTYLLSGIQKACESGLDVSSFVPSIVRCYRKEWSLANTSVVEVLHSYTVNRPKRLSELCELLLSKALWRKLLVKFIGNFSLWKETNYSPALPALVTLLNCRSKELRKKSAEMLCFAVSSKSKLNSVLPQLERLLGSREKEVRQAVAYALSSESSKKLRELTKEEDAALRAGAIAALGDRFLQKPNAKASDVLVQALADKSKLVRRSASRDLWQASRDGITIEFTAKTLEELFAGLSVSSSRFTVAQFLYDYILKNESKAKWISERAAGYRGGKSELFLEMLSLAEAVTSARVRKQCSVCKELGRRQAERSPSYFPEAIKELTPPLDFSDEVELMRTQCSRCSTWYTFTHDIDVTTLGDLHHFALDRTSHTNLLKVLKGEEKRAYRERCKLLLKQSKEDISSLSQSLRKDAAWFLCHHYFNVNEWSALSSLLLHGDHAVRFEVLSSLIKITNCSKSYGDLVPALECLQKVGQRRTKADAAKLLTRHFVRNKAWEDAALIAYDKESRVAEAALSIFRYEKISKCDVEHVLPIVLNCLTSTSNDAGGMARYTLVTFYDNGLLKDEIVGMIVPLLKHQSAVIRAQAVGTLGDLAELGCDISSTLPQIAMLCSNDRTQAAAMFAIRVAVNKGNALVPMLPMMATAMCESKCRGMSDAFWAIQTANNRGEDISAVIDVLGKLSFSSKHRQTAVPHLRRAAEKGFSLVSARIGLKKAMKDDSGFIRQEATIALTLDYLKSKEWEAAIALLNNTKSETRANSINALDTFTRRDNCSKILLEAVMRNLKDDRWWVVNSSTKIVKRIIKSNRKLAEKASVFLEKLISQNKDVQQLRKKCRSILAKN